MKKLFFISAALMLLAIKPAFAEEVADLTVFIDINADGSLAVREEILYDFGEMNRHGIYRTIPYKYKARGGNYNLRLDNFLINDDMGRERPFTWEKADGMIKIKIGDPDRFVSGLQKYNISYRVERALNFFDGHDELYWNVSGHDWEVPIAQSRAEIRWPEPIPAGVIDHACFSGPRGSTNECVSQRFIYEDSVDPIGISLASDKLAVGSGFTAVAALPPGAIDRPGFFYNIILSVRDNWILLLPLLMIVLMYYLWTKKGQDPLGRQTIIAEYGPPDGLSPALVGVVVDERADNHDISSELLHLAVRGYLRIDRETKSGLLKSYDYKLTLLTSGANLPYKYERDLLEALFGSKKEVKLSSLKNSFYKDLPKIKAEIYAEAVRQEYFPHNPNKVRGAYLGVGVAIVVLSWFIGPLFDWFGVASFVISGLIVLIFSFIMPRKTKKGVQALEHIKGFKEYLRVAEKDRIDFHNAPAKEPALFEKFLPFAMVLGVEDKWAEQFRDIYQAKPEWYGDGASSAFIASDLTRSLSSFSAKAESNLSSAPSSAASGGSGFSGGGSGGGFGGGGGGSW